MNNHIEKYIRNKVKNILKEIHDYTRKDIDDLGDTYNGYVYFHSKNPLEISDIKKNQTLEVDLTNRADASGTDSEYIYRIKTKKPLHKRIGLNDFLRKKNSFEDDFVDTKPTINQDDYSGSFSYNSFVQEPTATIKTDDISGFKLIGGFRKYDKHYPDKILDAGEFSEATERFLSSYIGGDIMHKPLTMDIWEELTPFRPNEPLEIFKGIEEVQIRHNSKSQPPYKVGQIIECSFPHLTSWTTNALIARRFIDDYPSSPAFVIKMIAKPEDMVVDVQKLPKEYYHANQREIILNKGTYKFKIIWAAKH